MLLYDASNLYYFSSFPSNTLSSQRLLSKRMYAMECARHGSSFGLLLSSNALLNLPESIHRLLEYIKRLLNKHHRSYYTFLMNTVSITKLNNFEQNIGIAVVCSSCSECQWLSPEHKQFNIPLISINDVIQALNNVDNETTNIYSFDIRDILGYVSHFVDQHSNDNEQDQHALVLKHPNALLLKQQDGSNRETNSARAWWGLRINDVDDNDSDNEKEKTSIAELKQGRCGIASGYTHEPV
jgi:hypothetical protein